MRTTKYLQKLADAMNIHGPSLGIGVAITAVSILGAFFVLGLYSSENGIPSAETKLAGTAEKQVKQSNMNASLFSGEATSLLGSSNAPITVIEFGDYQCFFCNKFFHNTEAEIVKNYVNTGKVKIIFKDFTIIGPDSLIAAHATHCANEEGKFWEYHDILYANWTGENNGWASLDNLHKFAKQIGLGEKAFSDCMSSGRYNSVVEQSNLDAKTLGLTGTPDFFIIGTDNTVEKIVGAQPYGVFEKIFESKLKK